VKAINNVTDLTNELLEVFNQVNEGDDAMPIGKAKTLASVGSTIIRGANSQKSYQVARGENPEVPFLDS